MSDIKHYKNVSYVKGHVRVNLRFAKYGPRFAKAQEWLGCWRTASCICR